MRRWQCPAFPHFPDWQQAAYRRAIANWAGFPAYFADFRQVLQNRILFAGTSLRCRQKFFIFPEFGISDRRPASFIIKNVQLAIAVVNPVDAALQNVLPADEIHFIRYISFQRLDGNILRQIFEIFANIARYACSSLNWTWAGKISLNLYF